MNSRAGHARLSFYRLVPLLRKEADIVKLQTRLVSEALLTVETRTKYTKIERGVQEIWAKYETNEMSTAQLLRGCSRLYAPSSDE